MANSIELAMVPEALSGAMGAFQWSGHYKAAGKGGSDFLGIYPLSETKILVVVGDAVGYELAGTMVATVVKSCCDEVVRLAKSNVDPATLLGMLNTSLYRSNRPALASCLAVLFDSDAKAVSYANAGHLSPYRLQSSAKKSASGNTRITTLTGSGPFLGDMAKPEFTLRSAPLDGSGCFVLLSDGLLAPTDGDGEEYGYRRFHRLLKKLPCTEPQTLRDTMLAAINTHCHELGVPGNYTPDDQALLVVKCS